jgi:DNA-binding NarL/FixJ family response regulator
VPTPNVLTEEDLKVLRDLHRAGYSDLRIARVLGIAPNTVRHHLGKNHKTTDNAKRAVSQPSQER